MSIVVAVKKAGKTCVAADSQSNFGSLKVPLPNARARKIRTVGPMILGTTGWALYEDILEMPTSGGKVLIHQDELGDTVCGLMAGYLIWAELIPRGPKAISLSERLFERQLGPTARELVGTAVQLRDAK